VLGWTIFCKQLKFLIGFYNFLCPFIKNTQRIYAGFRSVKKYWFFVKIYVSGIDDREAPSIKREAPSIKREAPSIKREAPSIKWEAPSIKKSATLGKCG